MKSEIEIKNAVIESATFDVERGLSAWLGLNYGDGGQGFGGYALYLPKSWTHHGQGGNFCGHFIWRVLEIAEVNEWRKLKGRTIRVRVVDGEIQAIGHIIKDDWFDPKAEFEVLRAEAKRYAEHGPKKD